MSDFQYPPPPSWVPIKKPPSIVKIVVLTLLGVLLLAGIGGGVYMVTAGPSDSERAAAEKKADAKEAKAKRAADIKRCEDEVGPYLDALLDLDARLDVGMNQEEFSGLVGDASVAKNRVDDSDFSRDCIDALVAADNAFDKYSVTNSAWNDCIIDYYCETDSLGLPSEWSMATTYIEKAQDLMRGTGGEES